ncbi:LapA family protein [Algibacter luteus]|uniref:LapA family protein n=1 Tax=Algibacter luteus TaxID=1178825 RepID=UPI002594DEAA|nr:LapA family protein [Algibacter luteus]WJJ96952.1 LapA family protein [Algibacter luteus]
MQLKTIIAVIFAIIIVVFSLQNAEVIDVKFLFWKLTLSRVLVILGSFSIGVLVGILVSMKKNLMPKKQE